MALYKIFSIFTGAGGLDLGFKGNFTFLDKTFPQLPFQTINAIEINKYTCQTLQYNKKYFNNTNIENINILNADIQKYKSNFNDIDVLIGGFPCVTFSIVGNRLGVKDDINGKLYESFVDFVEALQPKIFLAENVKGILSANNGEAIKIIKKRFEETGYKLKIKLVNFADYGVPQLRERVLFIGVRNDIKEDFIIPQPIFNKNNYISSQKALENIPINIANHKKSKQSDKVTERLKNIPEGGNFKDLPPEMAIKGIMSHIYRRLDRNKPSTTILANGGGGTLGYHFEEPRALTNRERARLQTFPDDFVFIGTQAEVRKQIGNAVPPVGIYPFATECKRILEKNKEKL